MSEISIRNEIDEYIVKKYKAKAEYLWKNDPNSCIYRHEENRKWFAIMMVIPKNKLGLEGGENVEIINLKLADAFSADLLATTTEGYFPAYHMTKGSTWITVVLDGTVPAGDIYPLIDESFGVTAPKAKKVRMRAPKSWIIPANPKYYDVEADFAKRDIIEWKQGSGIRKGDTVYMYLAAPVSAILYKCTVIETGIPYDRVNEHVHIKSLMRIRLERVYERDRFTFETLGGEFGIFAIRGPRGVPNALLTALDG